MGIDPFDFRDLAFEQHRSIRVEFRSKGVMSRCWARPCEGGEPCHRAAEDYFQEFRSHLLPPTSFHFVALAPAPDAVEIGFASLRARRAIVWTLTRQRHNGYCERGARDNNRWLV
jgi:hypothetical protein